MSVLSKWESIPLYDMHIMCITTKVNEVYSLAIKLTSQGYVLTKSVYYNQECVLTRSVH